ncbi:hypothetical protein JCM30237_25050 [Halolamina litorea]|uniref:DUF6788 domain-containing protein n=1 Tax=Halolamina litorea TaxID=1515593 RepID=A0ABD6BV55_9EURY|nr:hypothetical protein [Halolamina litorea]
MPDDPSSPEPPETLSESVVESVADLDAEELTALADYTSALSDYAGALATHRREARQSAEEVSGGTGDDVAGADDADDAGEDRTDSIADAEDRPEGVPAKASTTIKEINGNRYHYWQWRDGDKIRSQYKGPADAPE